MKKLTRSVSNKMFLGVCGGMASYFNTDATIIRVAFAIATVVGIGSPIIIYLIMALMMPKEDRYHY